MQPAMVENSELSPDRSFSSRRQNTRTPTCMEPTVVYINMKICDKVCMLNIEKNANGIAFILIINNLACFTMKKQTNKQTTIVGNAFLFSPKPISISRCKN